MCLVPRRNRRDNHRVRKHPECATTASVRTALQRLFRVYVLDVREEAEREADAYRRTVPAATADRKMVVVILTVALSLLLLRFFGRPHQTQLMEDLLAFFGQEELAKDLHWAMQRAPERRLFQRIYWAAARIVAYVGIPVPVILWVLKEPLRNFGTRTRGMLAHGREYAVLLAFMLPVVVAASFGSAFQRKYPYYPVTQGESLWPHFWAWELLYALQFVSLEFFYRGFFVHGLRQRMGYAAIFAMMVPYMQIHFGKPLPEAAGSVVAGFVLGTLSLRSHTVWWGGVLHVTVATSMDLLSLYHRGLLF